MKIKKECGACGSKAKQHVTITVDESTRNAFLEFISLASANGLQGVVPPSKYPKNPLVVIDSTENPCPHCLYGETTVGPSGCGRGNSCYAYAYYQVSRNNVNTAKGTLELLKEFTCAAPAVHWLAPAKKRKRALPAEAVFGLKPATSSAPAASPKKSVRRKSGWRK